ncbi:MAG: CpaD family pilus assembly protein [Parvularculaceae bacterium]
MCTAKAKLLLMAAMAALATGCAGAWNGANQSLTVAEEHPISVDSQVVTLTIALDPTTSDLSSMDKARLRAFADAYLANGHGPLTITAPSGAASDLDGEERASDIRKYLNEVGVDWSAITGASYRVGEDKSRELILSFTRYVATPSACGVWTGLKGRDYANLRSPNYGCATQSNLAALVADPRDLVEPADMTSADAQSRIRAIRAYREGKVTSSDTDADINAEIAQ